MDSTTIAVIAGVVGSLGSGALGAVIVKAMARQVDDATAKQTLAAANKTEVDMLLSIIKEVRESEAKKDTRIDALEQRLDKLEERERHMLTRAAVHEAWDVLSWQALRSLNPEHPPPPPLADDADRM